MMKKTWVYYRPKFECDEFNMEMMRYSPWSGHRNFAYDYVRNIIPTRIVELGSYYGCSSFSFLQAIKDANLKTEFYGIDTWMGDSFTENDYHEDIFGAYKFVLETCFSEQNGSMLRCTFDEACSSFQDQSIDLLHIDGSHNYEDVKHDFMLWKNKVRTDGAVFFHDISCDLLYGEVMGSHLFWEELKKEYPYTLEFKFSFGLGILFFEKDKYEYIKSSVDFNKYQDLIISADNENKDTIRRYFFEVRNLGYRVAELERQLEIKQTHLDAYAGDVKEKDVYISDLEQMVETLTQQCRTAYQKQQESTSDYERDIKELSIQIEKYKADSTAKQQYITKLEEKVRDFSKENKRLFEETQDLEDEIKKTISEFTDLLQGKESYIQELLLTIEKYKAAEDKRVFYINELEKTIQKFKNNITGKDEYIRELLSTIEQYRVTEDKRVSYINELEKTIQEYKDIVTGKDNYIQELLLAIDKYSSTDNKRASYISELEEAIKAYEGNVAGKDEYIQELLSTIEGYKSEEKKRKIYIDELTAALNGYKENTAGKDKYIQELLVAVEKYKSTEEIRTSYISELEEALRKYGDNVIGKEAYIQELLLVIEKYKSVDAEKTSYITELEKGIEEFKNSVTGKDAYIQELQSAITTYKETVAGKDQYICELEEAIAKYADNVQGKDFYIAQLEEALFTANTNATQIKKAYERSTEKLDAIYSYLNSTAIGKMIIKRMESKL